MANRIAVLHGEWITIESKLRLGVMGIVPRFIVTPTGETVPQPSFELTVKKSVPKYGQFQEVGWGPEISSVDSLSYLRGSGPLSFYPDPSLKPPPTNLVLHTLGSFDLEGVVYDTYLLIPAKIDLTLKRFSSERTYHTFLVDELLCENSTNFDRQLATALKQVEGICAPF